MKQNNRPISSAEIASQLRILENQFADAAKTFPTIRHIIAQRSKDGIDPIVPDMLTHSCRLWDEKIGRWPRCDDEQGYPTKHWLFFVGSLSQCELSEKQCMAANYDMLGRFCELAYKAGEIVSTMDNSILPISKTELWVRDPEEYWLLLLYYFYPPQRDFWFIPEGKTLADGELKMRPAQKGEPYSAVLENLFLLSALACGKLRENLQNDHIIIKAEEIKIEECSKPLFPKDWAKIFGVHRNQIYKYQKEKTYHFTKKSERKWVLPLNELPAEYLQKYRNVSSTS